MDSNTLSTLVDLLKQPSPRSSTTQNNKVPASGGVTESEPSTEGNRSRPLIFDLPSCERYRILKLIEELLDSQEEVDQLKQKLEDQKSEFREKRSALMKKLDILNEKHQKALSDIEKMKETHLESLTVLESKITMVSQRFEESVIEIEKLRKANTDLHKENLELLKLNSEVTSSLANVKEENSKLSLELKESKHKEKSFKKKLKKLSSIHMNDKFNTIASKGNNEDNFLFPDYSEQSRTSSDDLLINIEKLLQEHGGSGDGGFLTRRNIPSQSGITTIKAPSKMSAEGNCSAKSTDSIRTEPVSSNCLNTQEISRNSTTNNIKNVDSLDAAIIENLFFRF